MDRSKMKLSFLIFAFYIDSPRSRLLTLEFYLEANSFYTSGMYSINILTYKYANKSNRCMSQCQEKTIKSL